MDGKRVVDVYYKEAVTHCEKHFKEASNACKDVKALRDSWITKRKNDSIEFVNPPGSFGAGSCWAWSTERKNSLFLARFKPQDPPMRNARAIRMNFQLLAMGYVVEFPGVSSISELSTHPSYKSEWIAVIERLQSGRATEQGNISRATTRVSTVPEALKQNLEQIKLLESELKLGRQPLLLIDFGFGLFEQHIVSVVSIQSAPREGWKIGTIDPNSPGNLRPMGVRSDGTLEPYGWYRLAPQASIKFIPDVRESVTDLALVAECCFQETQKSNRAPSALGPEPFVGGGRNVLAELQPVPGTLESALQDVQTAQGAAASRIWARILTESSHLPMGAQRRLEAHLSRHPDSQLKETYCLQRAAPEAALPSKFCSP
jgi:hypothetical protein